MPTFRKPASPWHTYVIIDFFGCDCVGWPIKQAARERAQVTEAGMAQTGFYHCSRSRRDDR